MAMKPLLMGAEVEYSLPTLRSQTARQRPQFHDLLLDAIRAEHRWLPDLNNPKGIYIDNGSRYYLDTGNHNEFSSPELSTPRQIAVYDRAAEQILLRAKAAVQTQLDGIDVCITKNNINFSKPDLATWGQHEAYTCWIPLEEAAVQLTPHLASRVAYAGAGCLSAHPGGMGFELSQRARHMTRMQGAETTHERAIFCTRAWKSSDMSDAGWTRTNLISKDSQRCSFGMYLTYGVTALLFMMMNEGHKIGRAVQLKNPVDAMRAFSLDPWLRVKVPLANGKKVTAIDIQRSYIREAQPHVESGQYPLWTNEVLNHWAVTLEQLENNPLLLADRLARPGTSTVTI
jgi:proteasome accessory factor A